MGALIRSLAHQAGDPREDAGDFTAGETQAVRGGAGDGERRTQAALATATRPIGGARGLEEGCRSRVATAARIRGTWGEVNGRETTWIGSVFNCPCA